jgi:hypothetical protein
MHRLAETAELRTVSRQFARFALADAIVVTALQRLREGLRFRGRLPSDCRDRIQDRVDDIALLKCVSSKDKYYLEDGATSNK